MSSSFITWYEGRSPSGASKLDENSYRRVSGLPDQIRGGVGDPVWGSRPVDPAGHSLVPGPPASILWGTSFNVKLSGNDVYCMNALLLLIQIMLCSKLHYQKVFD